MTGIFRSNNPSGNAILFFYAIVLKLPMFMHAHAPQLQDSDGILYKSILRFISPAAGSFHFIWPLITFLLLFTQAISFNKIVNNQKLHRSPNFLTGMSYLLLTSLFPDWFSLSAPLLVNTIMIWIWSRLCALYNNPNPKSVLFNIGFAAGIATFIYFPSIIFLFLMMSGLAVARPVRLQEWLTGLMGIITPVYFFAAWLFLTDAIYTFRFPGLHFSYPRFYGNRPAYIALSLIIIAVISGIYFVNANMRRQVVQTRKSWQLLFLYLFVACIIPLLNAGTGFSYWILALVPLSPIVAATFFYPQKKVFPLLLHWAMFALYIAISFFL